ncbi:hypothetical protein OSB04_019150 [Centaurea solstitialis]|uniref:PGG domain-containing protein n=1 Tax=Centaurea solstitialis TaxID=347529 RepID=A0AA38W2K8_9ASTR|nr:hypothetical protein OSB04_019150 [Centaurea solstitialis]
MNTSNTSRSIPLNHQQQQQQNQLTISIGPQPLPSPQLNLPHADLIEGSRENYIKIGVPLYEASIKGNWEVAKAILDQQPRLVRFAITEYYETPLHIAAATLESTSSMEEFVENLVNLMEKKDLELQNKNYNTALSLAAAAGNVKLAKIMVKKNNAVLEIPDSQGMLPLYTAALSAKHDMVRYLYDNSHKCLAIFGQMRIGDWFSRNALKLISSVPDFTDVALKIVNDCTQLTTKKSLLTEVLLILAQKTDAFKVIKPHVISRKIQSIFAVSHSKVGHVQEESDALKLLRIIWRKIAMMPKNDIDDIIKGPPSESKNLEDRTQTYSSQVLFVATRVGNTRFIIELIQLYPDLIWKVDNNKLSIFHKAVRRRHANIYNLLYEIGSRKDSITHLEDENGNNMLHLVGKSAKPNRFKNVSGVALQMQRELLWYKEVEQMIPLAYRQKKNLDGETPHDIFTRKHGKLVTQGEEWMKNTASQCMVVATLIATIVFAAAFTLPGGYNQDNGIPIFSQKTALIVFVISDAISLIFSSTSVLMFLSILTSRYAERDFLESLPKKLMFGLATLFFSIMTMMVAFSASFFILYNKNLKWIPIIVTGFAAMPVILFAILQFRLLGDVFYSTYQSRYLFKPKNCMLYN